MYQAMALILACLTQLWQCIPICITRIATLLSEVLPSHIVPIGNSVLLQILAAAIYSSLLDKADKSSKQNSTASSRTKVSFQTTPTTDGKKLSICSFDGTQNTVESIALAIAEGLCSIDEDNKHTDEIELLLEKAKKCLQEEDVASKGCESVEFNQQMAEILVSDLLMTTEGKKGLKVMKELRNTYYGYKEITA